MNQKEEAKYLIKGAGIVTQSLFSFVTSLIALGVFNELGVYFKYTLAAWLVFFNWKVLVVLAIASIALKYLSKFLANKVKESIDEKSKTLEELADIKGLQHTIKARNEKALKYLEPLLRNTVKSINNRILRNEHTAKKEVWVRIPISRWWYWCDKNPPGSALLTFHFDKRLKELYKNNKHVEIEKTYANSGSMHIQFNFDISEKEP